MLITTCTHCLARFRVTPQQLNARQGQVRCGRCGKVFSDSVVSKSRSTASSAISTSATDSMYLPTRKRAPESPVICRISGKKRRSHSIGLPCLPRKVGSTISLPSSRS